MPYDSDSVLRITARVYVFHTDIAVDAAVPEHTRVSSLPLVKILHKPATNDKVAERDVMAPMPWPQT